GGRGRGGGGGGGGRARTGAGRTVCAGAGTAVATATGATGGCGASVAADELVGSIAWLTTADPESKPRPSSAPISESAPTARTSRSSRAERARCRTENHPEGTRPRTGASLTSSWSLVDPAGGYPSG